MDWLHITEAALGLGYGLWRRHQAAKAAAAAAAHKAELDRLVAGIEAGERDIGELFDYVKTLDPLWRPKAKAK